MCVEWSTVNIATFIASLHYLARCTISGEHQNWQVKRGRRVVVVVLTATFAGEPGLAGFIGEIRSLEVVVTTGAIRHAKLQSNRHHEQSNTQCFTSRMPFLSPNQHCQSTEGKDPRVVQSVTSVRNVWTVVARVQAGAGRIRAWSYRVVFHRLLRQPAVHRSDWREARHLGSAWRGVQGMNTPSTACCRALRSFSVIFFLRNVAVNLWKGRLSNYSLSSVLRCFCECWLVDMKGIFWSVNSSAQQSP